MRCEAFVLVVCMWVELVCSVPISPPIPVQSSEPGLRFLPFEPKPKVELEIFIEVLCSDSRSAWPVVKDVQRHYTNEKLDLRVQQLPLPYHRNGFLATQGIYVIEDHVPAFTFSYIDAVFANISLFSTDNTVNKTETEVLSDLADVAVASTGIDRNLFINDIGNKRSKTIAVWKYGVKRAVAATPVYFVNGVDVVVGTAFVPTFDEWIAFLDPIVNPTP